MKENVYNFIECKIILKTNSIDVDLVNFIFEITIYLSISSTIVRYLPVGE